jgi:hypothetical protein
MRMGWRKWHREAAVFAVFATMLAAGALPVGTQEKPFPELDPQSQPLKNQFNADVGKVRLLLILDPT